MRLKAGIGLLLLTVAAAGIGYAAAADSPSPRVAKHASRAPFGFDRVVYLSHVNTLDMPIFPGDPPFRLRTLFTVENDGFRLNYMKIGEHTGTHWGAPCHFNEGQRCAEDMNARDFFHPAVVIDARKQSAANVDYALTVDDLRAFEHRYGRIPDNAMVVMWTGFQDRWDDPEAYANADSAGVLHFPGIGIKATRWLIQNRNLGGLGIDTLGVDPGIDEEYRTNTALLRGHRIHIENMAGLQKMPPKGGWIIVGGVRNEGGSGSPATVFGLVP
ncbi:MAG TPA: cyclase family protein [Gaiellaceae bacterium]|nr:cyclase family protein [Gaiellaceae bacterium]